VRDARGLDDSQLASIRSKLGRATWKVEHDARTCEAFSMSYAEYYVRGTLRWTKRSCQPEHLDAQTTKSVEDFDQLAISLAQPSPIETSPGKP